MAMVIKLKKILYLLLALFMMTSCTKKEEYTVYKNLSLTAGFDTFIEIQIATTSEDKFNEYYNDLLDDFSYYNELFDIYHTYDGINNLKTINDNAGIKAVEVDQQIIDMLLLCQKFYELTDHEFDITMGPVLKIWHQYREEGIMANSNGEYGSLPSKEKLEKAYACTGWDKVEIDDENNTVYLNQDCARLDVGGVAKGYATEMLANKLENENVKMAVVNAGGNNRTINSKLSGDPWKVGIQNPNDSGSLLAISAAGSSSFVTSGDYQRFYIAEDGNSYNHIIDPKTLFPATNFRSVSVITKNSAIADILSTSLYTMSYEDGLALLTKVQKAYPDETFNALWIVDKDHKLTTNDYIELDDFYILYTPNIKDSIILP